MEQFDGFGKGGIVEFEVEGAIVEELLGRSCVAGYACERM